MTEEQQSEIKEEIFEVHNVRIGVVRMLVYATLANLLLLASSGFLLYRSNERSITRERTARIASEQATEASRKALCGIYVLLDDAYSSAKPGTLRETGTKLAAAIAVARVVNRCPPRKR